MDPNPLRQMQCFSQKIGYEANIITYRHSGSWKRACFSSGAVNLIHSQWRAVKAAASSWVKRPEGYRGLLHRQFHPHPPPLSLLWSGAAADGTGTGWCSWRPRRNAGNCVAAPLGHASASDAWPAPSPHWSSPHTGCTWTTRAEGNWRRHRGWRRWHPAPPAPRSRWSEDKLPRSSLREPRPPFPRLSAGVACGGKERAWCLESFPHTQSSGAAPPQSRAGSCGGPRVQTPGQSTSRSPRTAAPVQAWPSCWPPSSWGTNPLDLRWRRPPQKREDQSSLQLAGSLLLLRGSPLVQVEDVLWFHSSREKSHLEVKVKWSSELKRCRAQVVNQGSTSCWAVDMSHLYGAAAKGPGSWRVHHSPHIGRGFGAGPMLHSQGLQPPWEPVAPRSVLLGLQSVGLLPSLTDLRPVVANTGGKKEIGERLSLMFHLCTKEMTPCNKQQSNSCFRYIYIRAVSVNALIYAINLAALTH